MNSKKKIVILTGAGISAESGIKTFREQEGLWEGHVIEDIATPGGFIRNPDLVHHFYNERRKALKHPSIKPNKAHFALSKLQKEWKEEVCVITQNVDNMHERAKQTEVIHMHGELLKVFCIYCENIFEWKKHTSTALPCPKCLKTKSLRPRIVWFEEMPFEMELIDEKLAQAGLFISIGTSGNVSPAAGFVEQAFLAGAQTIEINLQPSVNQKFFQKSIYGKATKVIPLFVEQLLEKKDWKVVFEDGVLF